MTNRVNTVQPNISGRKKENLHPFQKAPHRTLLALTVPVLFSLIAEPLTGLADTAFVSRLGSAPLAALGVGTILLSGVFWIFNFLGIGSQTETAHALGSGDSEKVRQTTGLVIILSGIFGALTIFLGYLLTPWLSAMMGAESGILRDAVAYMNIRWLGAPAILLMLSLFGVLRGLQDMSTPLRVALGTNAINIFLDWILVFGSGPVPAMGVEGAAAASVISQWIGAAWTVAVLLRYHKPDFHIRWKDSVRLLRIGSDLFIRTGLLTLFLLITTRAATKAGADSGAAHQAIRQFWAFSALFLDSFAIAGQSLIGFFQGAGLRQWSRRVAGVVIIWSVITGAVLGMVMLAGEKAAIFLLVPETSVTVFVAAWRICAFFMPLNSISFATDGVHWGTGDFPYLRNAVLASTIMGVISLACFRLDGELTLAEIWIATGIWITFRSLLGVLRIWPGIGKAPLGRN
jgi:MATE family multidrug resistance protein